MGRKAKVVLALLIAGLVLGLWWFNLIPWVPNPFNPARRLYTAAVVGPVDELLERPLGLLTVNATEWAERYGRALFIPFKEPLPVYRPDLDAWLNLDGLRVKIVDPGDAREGSFYAILVLDKPVTIDYHGPYNVTGFYTGVFWERERPEGGEEVLGGSRLRTFYLVPDENWKDMRGRFAGMDWATEYLDKWYTCHYTALAFDRLSWGQRLERKVIGIMVYCDYMPFWMQLFWSEDGSKVIGAKASPKGPVALMDFRGAKITYVHYPVDLSKMPYR